MDNEGNIIHWNEVAERIFGYKAEEIIGEKANILYPNEKNYFNTDLDEIHNGQTIKRSWKKRFKDGSEKYVSITSSLIENHEKDYITASIVVCKNPLDLLIEKDLELSAIVSNSEDAIIGKTLEGIITSWNQGAEHIYGYTEDEAVGQSIDLIVPDEKLDELHSIMRRLKQGIHIDHLETKRINRKGKILDISVTISPIKDHIGKIIGASAIGRDITERKKMERELQESTARTRAILENITEGIITVNTNGVIESFNKAAEKIFGYSSRDILGQKIYKLISPDYEYKFTHIIRNHFEPNDKLIVGDNDGPIQGLRKDNSKFPMEISFSEVLFNDKKLYTGIVKDLSLQQKLEQRILKASEQEQQRLGRDLHDNIGQMLTGIQLMCKNLSRKLEVHGHSEAAEIKELSELIKKVDKHVRDLSRGLVTSGLEGNNLSILFQQLALKAKDLYQINCEFECNTDEIVSNENVAINLYRITQEAIRNAVSHGHAKHIKIILDKLDYALQLSIIDNGTGFEDSKQMTPSEGIGISTMKFRAHMLGGQLEIHQTENRETQITCIVPKID